jgi:phage-related tail protein
MAVGRVVDVQALAGDAAGPVEVCARAMVGDASNALAVAAAATTTRREQKANIEASGSQGTAREILTRSPRR